MTFIEEQQDHFGVSITKKNDTVPSLTESEVEKQAAIIFAPFGARADNDVKNATIYIHDSSMIRLLDSGFDKVCLLPGQGVDTLCF